MVGGCRNSASLWLVLYSLSWLVTRRSSRCRRDRHHYSVGSQVSDRQLTLFHMSLRIVSQQGSRRSSSNFPPPVVMDHLKKKRRTFSFVPSLA
ncbi:hypothetical protein BDW69DRAFT_165433 [Aspergillus filifer]